METFPQTYLTKCFVVTKVVNGSRTTDSMNIDTKITRVQRINPFETSYMCVVGHAKNIAMHVVPGKHFLVIPKHPLQNY